VTFAVSILGAVLIAWAILLALLLAWLWARGSRLPGDHDLWPEGEFDERRGRGDRRRFDAGPPAGMRERRSGFDRRANWVGATRLNPRD
jgi:hypothetical protein